MNPKAMLYKFLSSAAGRVLIGYFLFKILFILSAQASPIEQQADEICSPAGMQALLGSSDSISTEEAELLYIECRDQFLDNNKVSPSVKATVDDWIGTDLSKAEANEIFLALELALTSPKPERVSEQFQLDCRSMSDRFLTYYDTIEPLTSHMDLDLDSLLGGGNNEIDDQERELFIYVQYSQFCLALLNDE